MKHKYVAIILLLLSILFGLLMAAGSYLSLPAYRQIGMPPADLEAVAVEFDDIQGWLVSGDSESGQWISKSYCF